MADNNSTIFDHRLGFEMPISYNNLMILRCRINSTIIRVVLNGDLQ